MAMDSMNLWIDIAHGSLLKTISLVDGVPQRRRAQQLTDEPNLCARRARCSTSARASWSPSRASMAPPCSPATATSRSPPTRRPTSSTRPGGRLRSPWPATSPPTRRGGRRRPPAARGLRHRAGVVQRRGLRPERVLSLTGDDRGASPTCSAARASTTRRSRCAEGARLAAFHRGIPDVGWTMLYLRRAQDPDRGGDLARLLGDQAGAGPQRGRARRRRDQDAAAPDPAPGSKPPRRDPHGAPEPPSPPRVRTVRARGRSIKR